MDAEPRTLPQTPPVAPIADASAADPQSFLSALENRLEALLASRLDALEDKRRQDERDTLMARFVAEHPDYRELAASGALEAQKRANALLDDVGAYFAAKLETEGQAHEADLEKTRQEATAQAEAKALERIRTKRLARTLSRTPSGAGRGEGTDPDLAAPEKFGGINAVLAARLLARRQSGDI